jgi:Zn-dependent protease
MIIAKLIFFNVTVTPETITTWSYIYLALELIINLNVFIAVFNLLPVPPLDGSKVLFFFLKPRLMYKMMQYQQIIRIVFIILLFMPRSPLRILISIISGHIINGLSFLSGFIS